MDTLIHKASGELVLDTPWYEKPGAKFKYVSRTYFINERTIQDTKSLRKTNPNGRYSNYIYGAQSGSGRSYRLVSIDDCDVIEDAS